MRPYLLTALSSTMETQPFAAHIARAEVHRRGLGHAARYPYRMGCGWVQVEFFAADAASWRACQLALYRAFPAASGLRGDLKTGVFELPESCNDELFAWLAGAFEAPVVEHDSRSA